MFSSDAVPPQSPWNHPWVTFLWSNWHVVFGMCHCRAFFGLAIISRSFRIWSGWYCWFCCYCCYCLDKYDNSSAARVMYFMNLMRNSLPSVMGNGKTLFILIIHFFPVMLHLILYVISSEYQLIKHTPSSNTSLVFLQQKISVRVGKLWPSTCSWITISATSSNGQDSWCFWELYFGST